MSVQIALQAAVSQGAYQWALYLLALGCRVVQNSLSQEAPSSVRSEGPSVRHPPHYLQQPVQAVVPSLSRKRSTVQVGRYHPQTSQDTQSQSAAV